MPGFQQGYRAQDLQQNSRMVLDVSLVFKEFGLPMPTNEQGQPIFLRIATTHGQARGWRGGRALQGFRPMPQLQGQWGTDGATSCCQPARANPLASAPQTLLLPCMQFMKVLQDMRTMAADPKMMARLFHNVRTGAARITHLWNQPWKQSQER